MAGPTVPYPAFWNVSGSIPLSDVSTPLMFVSPGLARNINDATYLHIASTGILLWDFLNNLRNDFKLLFTHKIGIPTILYFTIRLTLIAYTLGRAVLLTAKVENCGALGNALNICLIISVACTATFFYLRVVAVYSRNPYVVGFFGLTWLATVSMAITFFKTFIAVPFPQTQYCMEMIKGNFLIATVSVLLFNDLLIYIAIAYRIYRIFLDYEFEADLKRKAVILLFGASLPVGSKIVLLESQLYCLIIVISKAFLVAMISIDKEKNAMFIVCHLVLVVVLSSRVYRELREISCNPQRRTTTDFHTGNLTSAEFADRAALSTQEHISRKTAEIEDDGTSIGGTTTRTGSFRGSVASYISDSDDRNSVNMHTFRHTHQREPSSQA
ncbi:hypothetical protein BDN70DRAFT_879062 [Pholiota conissans]|uniref:Uncharacterized protein n=1 Tax=Pholiota conissans TaxID=109636 RepID=A0A9P5Z133_9AGAR|nr:hypothetical protein BDN70DRAFT_879062 [Pholiota conissans]